MVKFTVSGSYKNTRKFLKKAQKVDLSSILNKYGQLGVEALSKATPKDTGKTASSWFYEISYGKDGPTIEWKNSNRQKGVLIAVILQYGHGTGTGGYVEGRDYINPALQPVFDDLAKAAWKEVNESS
jgi:hypothetical protein